MHNNNLIISVSGIRGIVGDSLTPEVVQSFAAAMGRHCNGGLVLISRDGRPSGDEYAKAVATGLRSAGCEVKQMGVQPTPTCGIMVRHLNAAGAIQITASHNPAQYNGLKLFGPTGMVLSSDEGNKVAKLFENAKGTAPADDQRPQDQVQESEIHQVHINRILSVIERDSIRERGFKVLVDANHGAGGPLARRLLKELSCDVSVIGDSPDGQFEHEPEPTEDNLRSITALVAQGGYEVTFALDPDADRLAVIDNKGRYIGEELTLVLATMQRLEQDRGPIVVNMSTSRLIEDIAREKGVAVIRTPVGEVNVVQSVIALDALMGGEGNGGVIDPRIGYVRDPFIGMALILNLLARTGQPIGEIVDGLPKYHIIKQKYQIDRSMLKRLYEQLQKKWPEAQPNHEDGLRLDWPDRWIHVRPSNTEPIVRVIAEAPDKAGALELCDLVGDLVGGQ